jgi:hypothetical protein
MHRRLQTNDAFAKFFRSNHFAVRYAPKVNYGQKIIKDGNEMKAAPFYLVYQGVSAKKLILNGQSDKIHLVPNDENIAFLFPKKI